MKRYFAWLFLLFFVPAMASAADEPEYSEGIDYQVILHPVPTANDGTVEVAEMFWYGCSHCYGFEPYIKAWLKKKPAKVNFIRIPAVFNRPVWLLHATSFYTAEALGKGEKMHTPIFDAIHLKGRTLQTREQMMQFFTEYGVNNEEFNNIFDSFTVQAKVQRAADLTSKYEIPGVPSIIVNGKYRVDAAGSYEQMLKIVDFLVRQEMKKTKTTVK